VKIKVTAGPDAGWEAELRAGRHIVGRSRHCAVVIDDPMVEPYHVLLTIDDEGGVDVVQLAGRPPVATAASQMDLGDSRLEFGPRSQVAGLVLGVTVSDPLEGGGGEWVVVDVHTLAIVDDHPKFARGQAIVHSLNSQAAQQGLTAPDVVLTAPGDPTLEGCASILELGARWRARWTPDVSQPHLSVRLHVAGRAKPRSCQVLWARRCPQNLT
jgi:hypothetical protein